jgi:hypothetical protein
MADETDHPDLAPDAAAPIPGKTDGVVTIPGILGEGADEQSVRIYLDATFSTFYEIPKAAVSGRQRVEAADSPFGVLSTVLHVRQGTRITVQSTSSRTVDHEFLSGDFTAPGSFRALTWAVPAGAVDQASRYRTSMQSGCTAQPRDNCPI